MAGEYRYEEVWKPIPNSSQAMAMDSRCNHTLYCGARGPGKTEAQLMRFRRLVGLGYGSFWRGIIFDQEYKSLDDLVTKSKKLFPSFEDGAQWLSSASSYKWVWPTGEELLFRVVKKVSDYNKFHGHEYPFIGWNELTKYPTPDVYEIMKSVNRTSFHPEDHPVYIDRGLWESQGLKAIVNKDHPDAMETLLPPLKLEIFSTTNSNGPGHHWVKKRFVSVAPFGQVVKTKTRIFNPRTKKEEDVETTQVTIKGSWRENPYLTTEYIALLHNDKDPMRRKAWLDGSWDIVSGGAISDIWDPMYHVLPRFKIPKGWRIYRSFDWGSTHPFSVGWWAVANGEEASIVVDGESFDFCPRPGSLIRIYEYYGASEEDIGDNKGTKLPADDIARNINLKDKSLLVNGWIETSVLPGPADNQIRAVRESDVDTIEKKMGRHGVYWENSDKSPGSRKNGLILLRDMLIATVREFKDGAGTGDCPGIYFMENCRVAISTLPALPRDPDDPDDVDTNSEDHCYDETRYMVMFTNKTRPMGGVNVKFVV